MGGNCYADPHLIFESQEMIPISNISLDKSL